MELEFRGFRIIILLYFKSWGTEGKRAFFPGNLKFQTLRNESLAIADHLYLKISKLALFHIKLLLKEDNILHILNKLNEYNKRFECNHHFYAITSPYSIRQI